MILYLVDKNVLQEFHAKGNANVLAWRATVRDDQLRISSIIYLEMRRGWEAERRKRLTAKQNVTDIDKKIADIKATRVAYKDREIGVDGEIWSELGALVGEKLKKLPDTTMAITARVHGLVVVTRNVKDFTGFGVDVLNPFNPNPVAIRL